MVKIVNRLGCRHLLVNGITTNRFPALGAFLVDRYRLAVGNLYIINLVSGVHAAYSSGCKQMQRFYQLPRAITVKFKLTCKQATLHEQAQ